MARLAGFEQSDDESDSDTEVAPTLDEHTFEVECILDEEDFGPQNGGFKYLIEWAGYDRMEYVSGASLGLYSLLLKTCQCNVGTTRECVFQKNNQKMEEEEAFHSKGFQ